MSMNSLDAVEQVLRKARKPLHISEITQRVLAEGLWATSGKTPAATINARLCDDLNRHGEHSRFARCGRGVFGLQDAARPPVTPTESKSALASSGRGRSRKKDLTDLEKEIERVRSYSGELNESKTRSFLVEPILKALGWNHPKVMEPEYPVGGRKRVKVDIALLLGKEIKVMVEVKRAKLEGHEKQLLEYCRLEDVPLGVLTNGRDWELYFGMHTKKKNDYLAAVINIADRKDDGVGVLARRMEEFLSLESVKRGEAKKVFKAAWDRRHNASKWTKAMQERWGEVLPLFESQLTDALEKSVQSTGKTIPRKAVQEFVQKQIGAGKSATEGRVSKQRVIPAHSSKKRDMTETMKKLLALLEDEPSATLERIAEVLGISSRGGAYSVCKAAETKGYIVKNRAGRTRTYTVTK